MERKYILIAVVLCLLFSCQKDQTENMKSIKALDSPEMVAAKEAYRDYEEYKKEIINIGDQIEFGKMNVSEMELAKEEYVNTMAEKYFAFIDLYKKLNEKYPLVVQEKGEYYLMDEIISSKD